MADDLLGEETRRLLAAATPGPWFAGVPGTDRTWGPYGAGVNTVDDSAWRVGDPDGVEVVVGGMQDEQGGAVGILNAADAELIAAAPRLLAGLLAERDAAVARANEYAIKALEYKRDAEEAGDREAAAVARVAQLEAERVAVVRAGMSMFGYRNWVTLRRRADEDRVSLDPAAAPSTPAPEEDK